jgi:hypothetical protein
MLLSLLTSKGAAAGAEHSLIEMNERPKERKLILSAETGSGVEVMFTVSPARIRAVALAQGTAEFLYPVLQKVQGDTQIVSTRAGYCFCY